MKEFPDLGKSVTSPQSDLFLILVESTAGGWTPQQIYTAMAWINDWEAAHKQSPVKAVK